MDWSITEEDLPSLIHLMDETSIGVQCTDSEILNSLKAKPLVERLLQESGLEEQKKQDLFLAIRFLFADLKNHYQSRFVTRNEMEIKLRANEKFTKMKRDFLEVHPLYKEFEDWKRQRALKNFNKGRTQQN